MGRTYSCWMLICWCITWPVGFRRLRLTVSFVFGHSRCGIGRYVGCTPADGIWYVSLFPSLKWWKMRNQIFCIDAPSGLFINLRCFDWIYLSLLQGSRCLRKIIMHQNTRDTLLRPYQWNKVKIRVLLKSKKAGNIEEGLCNHCCCTKAILWACICKLNLLKTKRNLLYIRNQFIPRSKHFQSRL